jgi:hypothetical protein
MELAMRYNWVWAAALALVAAGCHPDTPPTDEAAVDAMTVRLITDQQAVNGAVAESTVYPHYFLPRQAGLNDLGDRQLAAMASAYRGGTGSISVIRGDTPPALYRDRLEAVRNKLHELGVDSATVTVGEGLPGGPGAPSDYVLQLLPRPVAKSTGYGVQGERGTGGTGSMGGTSSGGK